MDFPLPGRGRPLFDSSCRRQWWLGVRKLLNPNEWEARGNAGLIFISALLLRGTLIATVRYIEFYHIILGYLLRKGIERPRGYFPITRRYGLRGRTIPPAGRTILFPSDFFFHFTSFLPPFPSLRPFSLFFLSFFFYWGKEPDKN
jgi:hypothetical protein